MPPPHDGNEYTPFQDLISVERIDDNTFRSTALPFSPGGKLGIARAYGGHVFAQSAWAACQTVTRGFLVFNVVGHFLLPASRTTPFIYRVEHVRDGRSYATRDVEVYVEGERAPCFRSTVSYKKPEPSVLDIQENMDLWTQYESALRGKRPKDFDEVPGVDVPWYWKLRSETGENDRFPGLESRKVHTDLTPYNKDRHPLDRRGLIFYRPIGLLPSDPNMHLCAHLYASDRNSLYIVANQMDVGDLYTQMSTLVHQISFHGNIEHLMFGPSVGGDSPMDDKTGSGRWFCKEDFTLRAANGRAMLHGRIWAANGSHIATVSQDGMIRFTKKPVATGEEVATIRERQAKWPPRGKL